jgi:hypothetical protein
MIKIYYELYYNISDDNIILLDYLDSIYLDNNADLYKNISYNLFLYIKQIYLNNYIIYKN